MGGSEKSDKDEEDDVVDVKQVDSQIDSSGSEAEAPRQHVIRSQARPSEGDIELNRSRDEGRGHVHFTEPRTPPRDPRILTEEDEMGVAPFSRMVTIEEGKPVQDTPKKSGVNHWFPAVRLIITASEMMEYSRKLPSRTRHSSRRRRETRQTRTDDVPGPSADGQDIEMVAMDADGVPGPSISRSQVSRRSLRNTLRDRSRKSVKRGPGDNMNLMERRTLRREELNQMDQFEIKNLPFCTWIGYQLSLAFSRTWNKISEGLKNFKFWGAPIREVEGTLGSGVSTYFRVLRWLLAINFFNLILALCLILVPAVYVLHAQEDGEHIPTMYNADNLKCTNPNIVNNTNLLNNITNDLFQFATGVGWMEKTPLYIGWYMPFNITKNEIKYRDSGCYTEKSDTYRCYTFSNPADAKEKREYSDKLFEITDDTRTANDAYNCDFNCGGKAEEEQCIFQSCKKCSDNICKEELLTTEYFAGAHNYTCYNALKGEASFGAADCQFDLIDEDSNLGLRCDTCRRNSVIYNFPLAYCLVGLSYFVLSLLFISKNTMKIFKKSATEFVGARPYSQLVMGGWDYNIANKDSAALKSKSILKSLKEELLSDTQKEKMISTKEMVLLVILRLFTNILCICAMGGVVYIYYIVNIGKRSSYCSDDDSSVDVDKITSIEDLTNIWDTYGPAIIVSASNVIFPIFFEFIGNIELYQFQSTRINMTIFRSFVMKIFSVLAYLWILYSTVITSSKQRTDLFTITDETDDDSTTTSQNVTNLYNCWEDYVGGELYRLIIIDFVVFCVALFGTEWCRRFMVDHNRFLREKLGITEFNISKEVLDICYKQMIFWAALFFCPLVSVVAFVEIILMFYLKKCSALKNVRPPEKVILNSSSSTIINGVFTIALLVVFIPIGYIIFNFTPSINCGPFRDHESFIAPLNVVIEKSGEFKTYVIDNLRTTSLVVVIIVIVGIMMCYLHSLSQARRLTISLLREQMRIENDDKRYLIEQIKGAARTGSSTGSVVVQDKIIKNYKEVRINKISSPTTCSE